MASHDIVEMLSNFFTVTHVRAAQVEFLPLKSCQRVASRLKQAENGWRAIRKSLGIRPLKGGRHEFAKEKNGPFYTLRVVHNLKATF